MINFNEAFNTRIEKVRDRFEKRKSAFAKSLAVNAAEAIKQAGIVAESQYELSAWEYAAGYLPLVGGKFRNEKEAIECAIASLTQHVLINATSGEYSNGFYNAVALANLVGTRAAIDELSYLVNHPAA